MLVMQFGRWPSAYMPMLGMSSPFAGVKHKAFLVSDCETSQITSNTCLQLQTDYMMPII